MANGVEEFPEIPGLRIERRLGKGGSASVFLATDDGGHHVAVKALNASHPRIRESAQQLEQEASVIGRLRHPNVVRIYRHGKQGPWHFLISEYLPGGDLKKRIREKLTVDQALDLMRKLASGLDAAHTAGVIHRDVKPENALFRANGVVALVDFGIASSLGHTLVGMSGTPLYMSPEAVTGGVIDARTDIYSLGCVFYEMLTGSPPYPLNTMEAILYAQVHRPVPMLPGSLWELQGLLDGLMCKERRERISSAKAVLKALDEYWLLAPQQTQTVAKDQINMWPEPQAMPVRATKAQTDEPQKDPWLETFEQAKSVLREGDLEGGKMLLGLVASQARGEVAVMAKEMLNLLG